MTSLVIEGGWAFAHRVRLRFASLLWDGFD